MKRTMSNCPYCHGIRARRIYCHHCRPAPIQPKPDKTVLVIRYPKTPEEKKRMYEAIQPYRLIRPVLVYSSPESGPLRIAEEFATSCKVQVTSLQELAPSRRVNPRVIESLVSPAIVRDLRVYFTHQAHAELAAKGYRGMFYALGRPKRDPVNPGQVVVIDFTRRTVFIK